MVSLGCALCLCSYGTWGPELTDSAIEVHRLRCPVACVLLVPRPGIEPRSPASDGGFLTTEPPGKSFYKLSWLIHAQSGDDILTEIHMAIRK